MNKAVVSWLIRLVIVIVAIIPIWYSVSHMNASGFVEDFMGNWAATMIGAIVGIPIALWLSRRQQKEEERREEESQEQNALARRTRILSLVKRELEHNRDLLVESGVETDGVRESRTIAYGLKDELWNAFSDGGELQWIKDLHLMDVISLAYHYIRRLIYIEKLFMEASSFPGERSPYYHFDSDFFWIAPLALQSIEQALGEIENR